MAEVWPRYFPQRFLRQGLSRTFGDNLIVSETDVGGSKSRKRSSHVDDPFQVASRFTTEQVERFWPWWRIDIGDGGFDFWFPAPSTHGTPLATDDGRPLVTDEGKVLTVEDWILVRFQKGRRPTFNKRPDLKWDVLLELDRIY